MKLGILTQPLHGNYGGLLQAYALQRVLRGLGHDAWMVRLSPLYGEHMPAAQRFRQELVWAATGLIAPALRDPEAVELSRMRAFADKYVCPQTRLVSRPADLARLCNEKLRFEGYVVGSDQVWRPCYNPHLGSMFLDFAAEKSVRRVAYAASFGVDQWEYDTVQTAACSALARRFDAVSVREDSAIGLCRRYLGVAALQVLDPTLLLEREEYATLVSTAGDPQRDGSLFCYLFDRTAKNLDIVNRVARRTGLVPFETRAAYPPTWHHLRQHREDCIVPGVTAWLRSFMDARMVVTDSFHGCVFSIIFGKPFIAIGNEERGTARFMSLLGMMGLENRLLKTGAELNACVDTPVNWSAVKTAIDRWRRVSLDFLTQALPL